MSQIGLSMPVSPVVSQIPEAMRGKAEQDPRWARAEARNQADCSDNTESRACGFEVSAEPESQNTLFYAVSLNYLITNHLDLFSRDR